MRSVTASSLPAAVARLARLVAAVALFLGGCGGVAMAQAAPAKPDDKWRIICMHDTLSDGVVVFRLTPVGGQTQEIKVAIKAGTYENDVARAIRDVFRATLPKELYHIETDDGEAVLVKRKKRDVPKFLLEFVTHNVNGLGIRVVLD